MNRLRRWKKKRFAMRVPVPVFVVGHVHGSNPKIVMLVLQVAGSNPLQHPAHVFQQQRFVFIDHDRSRRVQALHGQNAF